MSQHRIEQFFFAEPVFGKAKLLVGIGIFTQQSAHADAHVRNQLFQLVARRWSFQIQNHRGLGAAVADKRQGITGRPARRVVINGDVSHKRYSVKALHRRSAGVRVKQTGAGPARPASQTVPAG